MDVAQTATPCAGDHHRLLRVGQVGQHFIGIHIDHSGADRHQQRHVIRGFSGHLPPLAGLTISRLENAFVTVIHQGIEIAVGLKIHAAASTAITAIRAAKLHILFASETQAAITALSGMDFNSGFVDKLHGNRLSFRTVPFYGNAFILGTDTAGQSPSRKYKKTPRAKPRGVFSDPSGSGHRLDHHILATQRAFNLELYTTCFSGKDGVVFTHAGIHTSVKLGATLTNNNFACIYQLAAETLNAKALTLRIATVTSTTTGFFMRHDLNPLECVSKDQPWIPVIFTAVYH